MTTNPVPYDPNNPPTDFIGKPKTRANKAKFLEILRSNLGNVTNTAKHPEAPVSKETHWIWLKTDPYYMIQVQEIGNMIFDFVESNLYKQISKGDTPAMNLYFRYSPHAKKRGWIQQTDITSGGEKISIPNISISIIPPTHNDTPPATEDNIEDIESEDI
jgi:hypothetical protein